jgi:predicted transposase/invertase (TIGR01784 family)
MTLLDEIKLEGKQEGILEGKLEAAEKMLAKGMSLADILDVTGLKEADIRQHGLIK